MASDVAAQGRDCDYERLDEQTIRCGRCGRRRRWTRRDCLPRANCPADAVPPRRRAIIERAPSRSSRRHGAAGVAVIDPDWPCLHRGRRRRAVPCELCGSEGRLVPIYDCARHGECSVSRWGTSEEARRMASCLGCLDRAPPPWMLHFAHGLGDAVQLTALIRHLRHYEPGREIDVRVRPGQEDILRGVARHVQSLAERGRIPGPHERVRLPFSEPRLSYAGCPSTKVTRCLRDVFGLRPIPDLCRYEVQAAPADRMLVRGWLAGRPTGARTAVLHYQGWSGGDRKNLTDEQAAAVARVLQSRGYRVLLYDSEQRSPLPAEVAERVPLELLADDRNVLRSGRLVALIQEVALFVGIDSGPLHVAAATCPGWGKPPTPAIGVWTRNHPLHYCDLADHVTHLVPQWHEDLVLHPRDVGLGYFRAAYRHAVYRDLAEGVFRILEASC